MYPSQLSNFLATCLFFFPPHARGARKQVMKQEWKGTSCFSVPLSGGGGAEAKGAGAPLGPVGCYSGPKRPRRGRKGKQMIGKEEMLVGSVLFPPCHPPTAFPPMSLSKLNTHFPEKAKERKRERKEKRMVKVWESSNRMWRYIFSSSLSPLSLEIQVMNKNILEKGTEKN